MLSPSSSAVRAMDWKFMGQWFDSTFGHFYIFMNFNTIQLLSAINSAAYTRKESVTVEANAFSLSVLKSLYDEGYVLSYKVKHIKKINLFTVTIHIRYFFGQSTLEKIKFISSPRVTRVHTLRDISRMNFKKDTIFYSTDKGVLTLQQCKEEKIGGVALFVC